MATRNKPPRNKTTSSVPAPVQTVELGNIYGQAIQCQPPTIEQSAAQSAIETYKSYQNMIDCEDLKLFVNEELVNVKKQRKMLETRLAEITTPMVNVRRDALSAKQAAERLFAPAFNFLDAGERILKDEILRYERKVEQERQLREAEVRRAAESEQRRIAEESRRKQEEAARQHLAQQEAAAKLEAEGKVDDAEMVRLQADVKLDAAAEEAEIAEQMAEEVMAQAVVPSTSVKLAGTAITGTWKAEIVDVKELIAGIHEGSTPMKEAVRAKVNGKLVPLSEDLDQSAIQSLEISLSWFNERARAMEKNFSYRGVKAHYVQDLRVSA